MGSTVTRDPLPAVRQGLCTRSNLGVLGLLSTLLSTVLREQAEILIFPRLHPHCPRVHTNSALTGTNCCCSGKQTRDSLSLIWGVPSARLVLSQPCLVNTVMCGTDVELRQTTGKMGRPFSQSWNGDRAAAWGIPKAGLLSQHGNKEESGVPLGPRGHRGQIPGKRPEVRRGVKTELCVWTVCSGHDWRREARPGLRRLGQAASGKLKRAAHLRRDGVIPRMDCWREERLSCQDKTDTGS